MTLIVAEVLYHRDDSKHSRIICAADRRITIGGKPSAEQRKIFKSPRVNAAVSYFGLASTGSGRTFEDAIGQFVKDDNACTVKDLARDLTAYLTAEIPASLLTQYPSGFHVCGFAGDVPEFWFIRNIQGMNGVYYSGFRDYYTCSEELSQEHWKSDYDVTSKTYTKSLLGAWFANGDLRTHRPAWVLFDEFVKNMEAAGLVSAPTTHLDLEKRMRWKMEAIGSFYDIVSDEKLVGGGTDTFILTPDT